MANDKNNPGQVNDPAETPRIEQDNQDKKHPREGDYRNVEKRADSPESFDDDYEAEQENRISEDDARTEKEDRNSKQ